jgi:hypothetical protein
MGARVTAPADCRASAVVFGAFAVAHHRVILHCTAMARVWLGRSLNGGSVPNEHSEVRSHERWDTCLESIGKHRDTELSHLTLMV